jgi:hypothetical protein
MDAGRLPLPDLSEVEAERLRGTLEYPPDPAQALRDDEGDG